MINKENKYRDELFELFRDDLTEIAKDDDMLILLRETFLADEDNLNKDDLIAKLTNI